MDTIRLINNDFSGILGVLIAFITAMITLVYVRLVYKQMKISQKALEIADKQLQLDKQPCVVFEILKTYGTPCFTETRRQLHIKLELENVGDSPAISIYTFAHLELQHTRNVKDGSCIVNMDYIPDFEISIKSEGKATANICFETEQINMLVEDLRCNHEQNILRIKTNPYQHSYRGTILVIEVYYKNILDQWFRNTMQREILWLIDKHAAPRKTNNLNENTIPPCLLEHNTEFELQLISPKMAASNIDLVDAKIIQKKLEQYKEDIRLLSTTNSEEK